MKKEEGETEEKENRKGLSQKYGALGMECTIGIEQNTKKIKSEE